jgi:hypothetical protein
MWSGDQSAVYLSRFGWNGSGALILGDAAFKLYLEHAASLPPALAEDQRGEHYASVAEDVLRAKSSASTALTRAGAASSRSSHSTLSSSAKYAAGPIASLAWNPSSSCHRAASNAFAGSKRSVT